MRPVAIEGGAKVSWKYRLRWFFCDYWLHMLTVSKTFDPGCNLNTSIRAYARYLESESRSTQEKRKNTTKNGISVSQEHRASTSKKATAKIWNQNKLNTRFDFVLFSGFLNTFREFQTKGT